MRKVPLLLLLILLIFGIGYGTYYYFIGSVEISKIVLQSPDNSALKERVNISLNRPAKVQIEYRKKGSEVFNKTPISTKKENHQFNLLLLEPNSLYEYKVVIHNYILSNSSNNYFFRTREQSPWMVHDWIKNDRPHDPSAIGKGLMMLCYRGFPGYIAMVDGKGTIRWYWQDKKMGVRLATITPRNTILALLAPAGKDQFQEKKKQPKGVQNYYIRTGKIGFVGGTEIAEINLEGEVLWRINLEEKDIIFHHDLKMNENNEVVSIFRDYKLYDLDKSKPELDTLWGDGVMTMDTTGKVLEKWSAWDVWDVEKDERLEEFANDRFHFNNVAFDTDGNYLLSTPIENQIWKIDKNSGEIIWKLGKGGDFKMDSESHFYFQHAAHINHNGNLILFDNGDFTPNDTTKTNKSSRTLSFRIDTTEMVAKTIIDAEIPPGFYTSRMGSSYLLPNDNILQTSSKTGNVLVTDKEGNVLWVLNTYFIPYRAEYVPNSIWENYKL